MAFVRLIPNKEGIERLRTVTEALLLTERDRKGPLLIEMDRTNIEQVKKAFSTSGASVRTGPWPAWSPGYAASRKRDGLDRKMLIRTGTMRDKFIFRTHGSHIARWRKRLKYDFGALDDVAFIHQHALEGKPKRSIIDKTEADLRDLADTVRRFYEKRIKQIFRSR